ncbi:CobW family GTP-binding protein [Mucilaginibacter gilvus]|uniref:GTP-binding protein n=1 Tax=Mucilaginibacter gilvus TaxID=2305909 RepID=A0A3S3YPJ4_9SPHI|nr:GTP-binding protein [Mucilaginibacter gilvus]RWY47454.1 GTP-binding protein [Mucilaginibacter gilvus]
MISTDMRPVIIITGFLGAGKTTFLNELIAWRKEVKLAVIENEFGEEGIDGDLIISADNNVFELSNGCICCSLSDDFYDLLESLWKRKSEFDEMVIETTGIADPASIASPFLTIAGMGNYYQLKRVICLVDARHIERQLRETDEARKQISFGDILLITKTDLVEADHLAYLENLLQEINPFAKVLAGNKNGYPLDAIFDLERSTIVQKRPKFSLVPQSLKQHQHLDLVSLSFTFSEPFDIALLQHRLTVFLNFQAENIYRVKGIIYAQEHNSRVILQSVNTDLAISYGSDWKHEELKQSRIVFIGKELKAPGFEKMLRQCLALVAAK